MYWLSILFYHGIIPLAELKLYKYDIYSYNKDLCNLYCLKMMLLMIGKGHYQWYINWKSEYLERAKQNELYFLLRICESCSIIHIWTAFCSKTLNYQKVNIFNIRLCQLVNENVADIKFKYRMSILEINSILHYYFLLEHLYMHIYVYIKEFYVLIF